MVHTFLVLLSALALFFIFPACGKTPDEKSMQKSLEKAIEQSSGGQVKVDLSREQVKIIDRHGEATVSSQGNAP